MKKRKIGIIGAGWLGIRVAKALQHHYTIYTTTSSHEKLDQLTALNLHATLIHFPDQAENQILTPWTITASLDAIFCTVHIADRKSSPEAIQQRLTHIAQFIGKFEGPIFFTSSTGVYPNYLKEYREADLAFTAVPGEATARNFYPQATVLRLAGLMGGDRLLKKYKISNLDQPVNHIHYMDIARLVDYLITHPHPSQVYNVTAPLHPTKAAVIAAQNGECNVGNLDAIGRIINTEKIQLLDFDFKYPDPRYFHI